MSASLNLLCKTHQRPPPAPHAPPECSGQASAARWGLRGRRAWPVARPYLAAASCSWAARGPLDARNLHQAGQCSPRASPGHGDARGTVRGGLQRARGGRLPGGSSSRGAANFANLRSPHSAKACDDPWTMGVRWKELAEPDPTHP